MTESEQLALILDLHHLRAQVDVLLREDEMLASGLVLRLDHGCGHVLRPFRRKTVRAA